MLSKQHKTANKCRGFTLLEMLVALGILGLMSIIIFSVFSISSRASARMQRVEERHHTAVVTLRWMLRDLSSAFVSNHVNIANPQTTTMFEGSSDHIMFTYLGHERLVSEAKESDEGVVEYYLEQGDDGMNLIRREKPIIDMDPDKGGRIAVIATNVKELKLMYWDSKQEEWKDEWKVDMEDALKSGAAGNLTGAAAVGSGRLMKMAQERDLKRFKLPQRVYIRLVLADDEGKEYPFETQARIHMLYPLNF